MPANKKGRVKKKPRGKPFPKGVSGNPGGRPKYSAISEALRHILSLDEEARKKFKPDTYAEQIAMVQVRQAIHKKNPSKGSAEFVANRAEGLPTATIKSTIDLNNTQVVVDILQNPDVKSE